MGDDCSFMPGTSPLENGIVLSLTCDGVGLLLRCNPVISSPSCRSFLSVDQLAEGCICFAFIDKHTPVLARSAVQHLFEYLCSSHAPNQEGVDLMRCAPLSC